MFILTFEWLVTMMTPYDIKTGFIYKALESKQMKTIHVYYATVTM
jgi:hypothetical protein